MRHGLILPSIGHGATDMIDLPFHSIFIHLSSLILVLKLNTISRKMLLVLISIYHLSDDMPLKYSVLFHPIMIKFPIIAKLYFTFYHTPLHYIRTFSFTDKYKNIYKCIVGIFISIISKFAIKNNIDIYLNKTLGEYWWVSPIIGHIILTMIIKFNI
tara:strand:+ start:50 stop:520 length:471 start_codon:yes stop_codon:yes gene_type:complete